MHEGDGGGGGDGDEDDNDDDDMETNRKVIEPRCKKITGDKTEGRRHTMGVQTEQRGGMPCDR